MNITFCSGPSYFVSFNVSQAWFRMQPGGPTDPCPCLEVRTGCVLKQTLPVYTQNY